jgi:dTDP-glucose 4,6-dehydratase
MRVLLYGSNGWIGGQFIDVMESNNIVYTCGTSRVDDDDALRDEIASVMPTHVVSFIGRTHGRIGEKVYTTIDYLEEEGKLVENMRDNLYGPLLLSELCKQMGIHFTYLGTGCIFKFDEDHPFGKEENGFVEDSLPNFFGSSYSVVKGFTDRLMKFYKDDVLNLRIRMPITGEYNGRNFITKITTYEKVCSVPNSMTVLPELLPFVLQMMKDNIKGTINLTNPGLVSHNEILEMYKEIVDPDFTYKNFNMEEQRSILAADRSNNFLETTKLEKLFPQILNIKDSIRDCLLQYKQTLPLIEEEVIDIGEKTLLTRGLELIGINPFKSSVEQIDDDHDLEEKNILITGGCGFIGSNFINYYFPKMKFNKLVNLDAMYYCASEENVDESIRNSENYILIRDNLTNFDMMKFILRKHKITHVIHFAAQSHVQDSFTDALRYTNDNIVGTHTLLEASRLYGKLDLFIHVSTDEVYGESMNAVDESHKTEHSILCPTNPYAATKAGAELIAQSYNHSFKMPIIITRGNNVYGPNQYPEKLIPRFINLLKQDKPVTIQGDGTSVRAFLHTEDTVRAFETILEKGTIGEVYNIGCDEEMEYSVIDVAKILIKQIKDTDEFEKWITFVEDRPFNDQRYYICNKKLKELGWEVNVNFEDGIQSLFEQ